MCGADSYKPNVVPNNTIKYKTSVLLPIVVERILIISSRWLKDFQIYENKHVLRENKLLCTSFHFTLHDSNKFMCKQKEGIIIYTMHIYLRCLTRYRRARRRHE